MKVPLLDLKRQYEPLRNEVLSAMERLFDSGAFILGPDVQTLEKSTAEYLSVPTTVGVSNGTDALYIGLRALGIGPGDKVLTTPFTFFATISAIVNAGAEPVFADIYPDTYNIDPASVKAVLEADKDRRIKAMIPVHLYGQAADMDPLLELAKKYSLGVVEDAAQAIGTEYKGRKVGSIGDVGCFSFFPSKNLGSLGDAGLVSTTRADLATRVKLIRTHGSSKKYHHEILGGNFRIDTLQAAFLNIFLPHLDGWIAKRQKAATYYDEKLAGLSNRFTTPKRVAMSNHTFHQYTIRVREGSRDALQSHLNEQGIGNSIYYPIPCHLQKAVSHLGFKKGLCPISEKAADEAISLPIFPEITHAEQDAVVAALANWGGSR